MVVGLGNPGPDFQETRHNAGFWYVERWAGILGLSFLKPWFRSYSFCQAEVAGDRLVLVKPLTWMNRSGRVFGQLFSTFGASHKDLLVVFDQMDLPPGRIRMKPHGTSAGHNGLKSIDEVLGGGDYHRLAVGVGRPVLAQGVVDHVLGVFSQEDRLAVDIALDRSAHLANSFWRKGWEPLTHALNQRDHDTA